MEKLKLWLVLGLMLAAYAGMFLVLICRAARRRRRPYHDIVRWPLRYLEEEDEHDG